MAESKGVASGVPEVADIPCIPQVTEGERDLAQQVTDLFEKENYEATGKGLKRLAETRSADPRVCHNIAILDYYKSGFTKTDEFQKAMSDVCVKAHVTPEKLSGLDDVDQCVFYYNHAVLLYQLRQYRTALEIVEKLFQFNEPMEEGLSHKVMFLLLELQLCTHQPEKAIGMLSYIEKNLLGNGKSSNSDREERGKDREGSVTDNSSGDTLRQRISVYKIRCYLMLRSMKSCKREMKSINNSAGVAPIVYLRANFEYLRGNLHKAIKILNSCSPSSWRPVTETGQNLSMMYYNNLAAIHFHLHKPNLGVFYFRKAIHENDQVCREFNAVSPAKSLSGRPLITVGISRHHELLYNLGIQLLHAGQCSAAFDCLIDTVTVFSVNPRLWLRLAECVIMAYRNCNDDDRQLERRLDVVKGAVGSGVHRKIILGAGFKSKESFSSKSPSMPGTTLEFAALCLRNALALLPEDPLESTPPPQDDSESNKTPPEPVLMPAPPSNPLRPSEVQSLRCSILASSAYVALCLNDYLMALKYSEKLLKQPRKTSAQEYIGHMYKAEALVALDQIADAISQLNPDNINDISLTLPESKFDQEKGEKNGDKDGQETSEAQDVLYSWSPKDIGKAKAIMQYNLASAHAIRGEYEKALLHLEKSITNLGTPLPASVYSLKIYVELMQGRRNVVQTIMKESFGHISPKRL